MFCCKIQKMDGQIQKIDGQIQKMDGQIQKMDGQIQKMDGQFQKMDGQIVTPVCSPIPDPACSRLPLTGTAHVHP